MKITKSELREIIKEEISKLNKQPKMSTRLRELINKGWVLSEEDGTIVNPETGRKIKVSSALSYPKDHPAYKAAASGKEAGKSTKKISKDFDNFEKDVEKISALLSAGEKVSPKKIEKAKVFLQDKMENVLKPKFEEAKAKAAKNEDDIKASFAKAGLKINGQEAGYPELVDYLSKKSSNPRGDLIKMLRSVHNNLPEEDRGNFISSVDEYDGNVGQMKMAQAAYKENQKLINMFDQI